MKGKVYVAGKLCADEEREFLEKIDKLCKNIGLQTFLPHRDIGLAKNLDDAEKVFEGDIIQGFKDIDLIIAVLDGLHVGAGTAWELGYAYANKIPALGIKTDEKIDCCLESLSAILIHSMKIVESLEELKVELIKRFS